MFASRVGPARGWALWEEMGTKHPSCGGQWGGRAAVSHHSPKPILLQMRKLTPEGNTGLSHTTSSGQNSKLSYQPSLGGQHPPATRANSASMWKKEIQGKSPNPRAQYVCLIWVTVLSPQRDLKRHWKFLPRPILSSPFCPMQMTARARQLPKCQAHGQLEKQQPLSEPPPHPAHECGHHSRWLLTCSLLLLFSKPGFFFFLMGLVDVSCGEWPLEEWGGLGNFLFWAVLSVEPGSERHTEDHIF